MISRQEMHRVGGDAGQFGIDLLVEITQKQPAYRIKTDQASTFPWKQSSESEGVSHTKTSVATAILPMVTKYYDAPLISKPQRATP